MWQTGWWRPPLAELVLQRDVRMRSAVDMPRAVMPVAAVALLAATVLFNPLLAWVNSHVAQMSGSIVSVMQGGIVISALLMGLFQPIVLAARWWVLAALLVMVVLLTSAIRAQFNPKILGDVLLIPAFILLGTALRTDLFRRSILVMQACILLVGIWELARPDQYGAFFNVVDYYVNTRGYDANAFWAGGSLFLSSERPGGRLLLNGLGFQCHFGSTPIPPARILSGLDRFGRLGLPIAITEFDMDTTDENLQARYMRDFLTAAFSHPSVESIVIWGFWEGRHWLPNAALYRKDWTLKPNGRVWRDLVKHAWWTNADGRTHADGAFRTRAFYGDYQITVAFPDGHKRTVPFRLGKGRTDGLIVVTEGGR